MEKKKLSGFSKSRGLVYVIALGVVILAVILVFSKVNFNKAAEYIAGMDLENAEKYLKKSKITWLKLNDYEKTDQLCFENGNQLADSGDYEKMVNWFMMIQDTDFYASEIKEVYIEGIMGVQNWDEEAVQIFESMDIVLNAKSKLVFPEKDKNETLSQFISKAVEQGNLEKAKDIILYKMELGYVLQENLSDIYQVAGKYLRDEESDPTALKKIQEYLGVESADEYIENISICEEVCSGEISLNYLEKVVSWEEFGWREEQKRAIEAAKDFMEQLQGCYAGGRPYYFYIKGYKIYWGDETGVSDYAVVTDSCKYVESANRIEIEGGYGERYISIESEDEIKTNIHTYNRVEEVYLPDTFEEYR